MLPRLCARDRLWFYKPHVLRCWKHSRSCEGSDVVGWQPLPLHWNRWVGVVSRSLSAMDSGLLHLAMPGSLYPAFTHSDNQRRLQSQWRGLVPRALEGRRGS